MDCNRCLAMMAGNVSLGATRLYKKDRTSMPDNKTSTKKRTPSGLAHNFIKVNTGQALLSDSPGHGHFHRKTILLS